MSTRFDDLSSAPGVERVRLGRLNLEEENGADWETAKTLYDYYRKARDSDEHPQKRPRLDPVKEESTRKRALKLSCGIPLAIATIGSLICARRSRAEAVLSSIERKVGGLASESTVEDAAALVNHAGLHAAMSESLKCLDESKFNRDIFHFCPSSRHTDGVARFSANYDGFVDKPVSSRYAALEAMDKSAAQFSFEIFRHLWHLKSAFEAEEVAQWFVNLGLGRIERHGESSEEAVFKLHDLHYAYCSDVSSSFCVNDDGSHASVNGHQLLLSACESTFGPRVTGVDWASVCFSSEQRSEDVPLNVPEKSLSLHLGQNLFSHLREACKDYPAQAADEMFRLLTDFRWLRGRGAVHGRDGVISDFMKARPLIIYCDRQHWQSYLAHSCLLQRVAHRVPEHAYVGGQLAWHILGRLQEEMQNGRYSEFEVRLMERFVRGTEENVHGAWLRPRSGCFSRLSKDPRLVADISVRKQDLNSFPVAELGDGEHIVSGGSGCVQIHNILPTKLALRHSGCGSVEHLAVGIRDESYIVFSANGVSISVMKVTKDNSGKLSVSGAFRAYRFSRRHHIYGLSVSKDGHQVAVSQESHVTMLKCNGGDDSLVYERTWEFALPDDPRFPLSLVAISQSGDFVVAAQNSMLVFCKETDIVEGWPSQRSPTYHVCGAKVLSIALSQNGSSLLVGLTSEVVEVWDTASKSRRGRTKLPEGWKNRCLTRLCVCFLEESHGATGAITGDRAVVGVDDSVVEYCGKDLSLITEYELSSQPLSICAWSSRSGTRRIAAGCEDGLICVLIATKGAGGTPGASDTQNSIAYVSSVAVAPKRDLILAGHENGMVSMWNASTGYHCGSFETKHSARVTCIDVSDYNCFAVSGSDDMSIRVWNLISKNFLFVLNGHSKSVYDVRYSGNGRIVSSDLNGEVRVWHDYEGGPAERFASGLGIRRLFLSQDEVHCYAINFSKSICWKIALETGQIIKILRSFNTNRSANTNETRLCIPQQNGDVNLCLHSGNVWKASPVHDVQSDISFSESAADAQESNKINIQFDCPVRSIAAALTRTETFSPPHVIVACCLKNRETPAILHYMFSK